MRLIILNLALVALVGCGDPLDRMPRLADVDLPQGSAQADALPDPDQQDLTRSAPVTIAAQDDGPRTGLLGFLRRKTDEARAEAPDPAPAAPEAAPAPEQESIQLAALAPPPEEKPAKKGLFAALRRGAPADQGSATAKAPAPGAPDYEQVGPGVTLAPGKVARLCGAPANRLGKKAESFPARGGAYTLYDSAPGSTAPRSFYLTGFDDGCARQFTAALVMFGSVETYEQFHYGTPGATLPRSDTDQAYEALKSRVCRVAQGKPCGSRISALSRNTAFVSVYERFENNSRWTTMLVHDGQVLAVDTKG
ncbi:hypothetical protein [Tropicibacter oceani]|uniref:Uncharacterized protein n=1 Tax=Tropicibacter oceani TaxID=3058420 RepID=A0ABY8QKU9_9RHOB|nr:hypothetical protein [Tropicibacter oceani]WGW05068.1 hypothetical protein QF118_05835 [Tropicibacter oceani]